MKLIIDIPDTAYEAYKEWHKQGVSNVEQSLIALAMPYEEKPKYFPPCEECNKKMEEIRQAYDKMKVREKSQDKQRGTDVISYIDGLIDGADAVRPHGEWNSTGKCSVCGMFSEDTGNFCSNCGADMRGDNNG